MGDMISAILGEIDDRWSEIFQSRGQSFTGASIVLFRNATKWRALRHGAVCDGTVLLSAGKEDFPRHRFFSGKWRRAFTLLGQRLQIHAAYIIAHEAGHPRAEPARLIRA